MKSIYICESHLLNLSVFYELKVQQENRKTETEKVALCVNEEGRGRL